MRILLLNLTRFGDMLQSQPLIRDLVAAGHTVGLVGLEQFAGAARLLQGVTVLPPLPGSALLRSVHEDWRQGCVVFEDYANLLQRDFAPDVVFNLTASLAGRLLARRLASNIPLLGFGVDEHGFGQSSGLWVAFFEASSRIRGCSPYNIVDLFRKMAHPLVPASAASAPGNASLVALPSDAAARIGGELEREGEHRCFVAFQLGASEERRQWPVASFAALGQRLAQHGITPVLLGTAAEAPLAEAYVAAGGVGVNRVGQTSLPDLAATLLNTRLLVTNDTGTMHLAAGLGVPSLSIFLATAQPWDTGPYLADCCCLEPDLPCHPCGFGSTCPHDTMCRTQISPACVEALVRLYLDKGRWPTEDEVMSPDRGRGIGRGEARIWRTETESSAGWTRMNLVSLSGHEHSARTALLRIQRWLLRQFLDCENANTPHQTFTPPPETLLTALPAQEQTALCQALEQADGLLRLLQEQGKLVGVVPSAGQRFLQTLHAVTRLFEETPVFNALGRLWLTTTQERGDDLQRVVAFALQVRRWLAAWPRPRAT